MILKTLLAWLIIALAETLHGILRVKLLNPRLGDKRARQFSVVTGSLIILLIGWLTVPWIGPRTAFQCLGAGSLWLILMVSFDFTLGRLLLRASWERLLADFDLSKGGYLGFGMMALFLTPLIIAKVCHLF